MTKTAAFDIYGTLADTAGIAPALAKRGIANAAAFAARWRDKQLEYTFRRALMKCYAPFSECTKAALDFVIAEQNSALSDSDCAEILAEYAALPSFADAAPALSKLAAADVRLFAFSNGESAAVRAVLEHNNLAKYFRGIVSADDAKTFKPDLRIYAHFLQSAGASAADTWLVSGNSFDIIGARAAGWNAIWANRGAAIFDPWTEFAPSKIVKTLAELPPLFSSAA